MGHPVPSGSLLGPALTGIVPIWAEATVEATAPERPGESGGRTGLELLLPVALPSLGLLSVGLVIQ